MADYGQILSADTLAIASYGGLNLHASLLPKYRGAAPINWALYHGETETGVTVIHMTPKIDAGPCVAQAKTAIAPDETAEDLELRLAELGAPLVCDVIDELQAGRTAAIPQDPQLASKAPRLKKTDGLIRWDRTARQVHDQIRAFWPWPKCYSFWKRPQAAPLRLIVRQAAALGGFEANAPGVVVKSSDGELLVATGEGAVSLEQVQPSGKRMLSAAEFLRGYPVAVGDTFGDA